MAILWFSPHSSNNNHDILRSLPEDFSHLIAWLVSCHI